MTNVSIQQAVNLALELHRSGKLRNAEEVYRQILQADPSQPVILHYFGLLLCQTNRHDEGLPLLDKSVALHPSMPQFQNNFGEALRKLDRFEEAATHFRAALALNSQYAEAWNNLALTLAAIGYLPDAIAAAEKALACRPNLGEAHNNLANLLRRNGRLLDALAHYQKAIDSGFAPPALYNNLGTALLALDQPNEAITAFQKALSLQPDLPDAMLNLAAALEKSGQSSDAQQLFDRALKSTSDPQFLISQGLEFHTRGLCASALSLYNRALELNPNDAALHAHIGNAWLAMDRRTDAHAAYQRSLALLPGNVPALSGLAEVASLQQRYPEALVLYHQALQNQPDPTKLHFALGIVHHRMGSHADAVASFRRALELDPDHADAHSCVISARLYDAADDLQARFDDHRAWAIRHAEPLKPASPPPPRATRNRPRIGYLSPDFRFTAPATFLEPILASHDHSAFEIFCYHDATTSDHVTERFRRYPDIWRNVAHLSHSELADLLRRDDLDILIDLSGHYLPNRLKTFAAKPAPIQISYLGYQFTTGMSAIDYRLTDAFLDPPGISDPFYTEKLLRLPHFACYAPRPDAPPIAPSPALTNNFITFGSFQRLEKQTPATLHCWSEILDRTPGSKLLQIARGTSDPAIRIPILDRFNAAGIPPDRIELVDFLDFSQYLALHAKVDIVLDTSPFNGHTTTCHALWMGVPVVTLPGRSYASRMTADVLTCIGHPELIAADTSSYIDLAIQLAQNPPTLDRLRQSLRPDIQRSPLCDAPRFTRELENTYRQILQNHAPS